MVTRLLANLSFVILSSVMRTSLRRVRYRDCHADQPKASPLQGASHPGQIPFHLGHSGVMILAATRDYARGQNIDQGERR
jgi:hypothetical protein